MSQKFKIKYGYQTGNSYGSESLESELELTWTNLDVAKENLKRIREHYEQYMDLSGYGYGDRRSNLEILKENENKDWFVKKKDLLFLIKKILKAIVLLGKSVIKL